jgi:hypothetical protein
MNRDGYSADGAVEIMRYATTAICPEMQTVVRRDFPIKFSSPR